MFDGFSTYSLDMTSDTTFTISLQHGQRSTDPFQWRISDLVYAPGGPAATQTGLQLISGAPGVISQLAFDTPPILGANPAMIITFGSFSASVGTTSTWSFAFTTDATAAVPLPPAGALLAAGLVWLGLRRARA